MLDTLISKLESIQKEAEFKLSSKTFDEQSLEAFRIHYLGRNGIITQVLKELSKLQKEDRPKLGQFGNQVKNNLTQKIDALLLSLKEKQKEKSLHVEADISLPGRPFSQGKFHPLTQTMEELIQIFSRFGFQVAHGPEIETDYYCFESLNIPKDHPSRDMHDTFYVKENLVLRTHTSPVQIRIMEKFKPPLRILAPGTVYRHDQDRSHTPMFHQIEGLLVDEDISFAHLKGILTYCMQTFFSAQTKVRFRPSYFPFTEPSAEMDIQCVICEGKGCGLCKQTGWLEILGCGMVHPKVFEAVNYTWGDVTGFAFGLGIERMTMLKYRMDHIRHFYDNDLRFLRQF